MFNALLCIVVYSKSHIFGQRIVFEEFGSEYVQDEWRTRPSLRDTVYYFKIFESLKVNAARHKVTSNEETAQAQS